MLDARRAAAEEDRVVPHHLREVARHAAAAAVGREAPVHDLAVPVRAKQGGREYVCVRDFGLRGTQRQIRT